MLLSTLLLPTGTCLQAELSVSFITGKSPQGQRSKRQRLRYGRRNIHLSIVPYRAFPVPGLWGPGPHLTVFLVQTQKSGLTVLWATCHKPGLFLELHATPE